MNIGATTSRADIEKPIVEKMESVEIEKEPSINEAYINLSKPSVLFIGKAIASLAIVIEAGKLVIYYIFYIAIINSIKEYEQLRTIGMAGKQFKRIVFREEFSLSAIVIPAGLVVGTLLSYFLIPQGFQIASLLWICPFVALLIYLTVRFSIRKPAMIAATVSPIDAYHYTGSQTRREKSLCRTKKVSSAMLAEKHILKNKRKMF